jgi:hypothetical protein
MGMQLLALTMVSVFDSKIMENFLARGFFLELSWI